MPTKEIPVISVADDMKVQIEISQILTKLIESVQIPMSEIDVLSNEEKKFELIVVPPATYKEEELPYFFVLAPLNVEKNGKQFYKYDYKVSKDNSYNVVLISYSTNKQKTYLN